jgi:hypothetical protein
MLRFQLETLGRTGSRTHTRFTTQIAAEFLLYLLLRLECQGNYLCGWLRKKGLLFLISTLWDFRTEQDSYFPVQFSGHTQRNAVNIRAILEIS